MKWIDRKVSIIILVVNELYYLKRCIESIKRNTSNYELIIIENNSSEQVKNYVKSLKGIDLNIIFNEENKGFPYGCNQGIKVAKNDLLLFLNSDTVVTPNWLNILKKCFDQVPDAGIVSPYTAWASETEQRIRIAYDRRFLMTDKQIDNLAEIVNLKEGYVRSNIIGFCMLIKKEVFEKVGVFDWHTWKLGHEEEIEFQRRAKKLGYYSTYLARGCYVHHFGNIAWNSLDIDTRNYNIVKRQLFRNTQDTTYNYKFIENDVELNYSKRTNIKSLKIAWVADFSTKNYKSGGAQYTNELIIKAGRSRGHIIDEIYPETKIKRKYDLYILNNIRYFKPTFIKNIINNEKYIKYEHDYWIADILNPDSPYNDLLNNSLLNLFMSKKHIEENERKLGLKIPKSNYILSPIDTELFYIDEWINKEDNLAIWTGHDEPDNKGFTNLIKYAKEHSELQIKAFGRFKKYTNNNTPNNIEIMGEVTQIEFAQWLKRARYVIALPNWLEPTGRSVMEGLLCGCTLIVNDRIGFLYEDIDFDNYNQIKKAVKTEYKLWNLIEELER